MVANWNDTTDASHEIDNNYTYVYNGSSDYIIGDFYIEPQELQNVTFISPEKSALDNLLERLQEFRQWLQEEHNDLEEECGADLSGLLDKLEETFPELSGEPETADGFDNNGNIVDANQYLDHFRDSIYSALGVRDIGLEIGYGSNLEDFVGRRENED